MSHKKKLNPDNPDSRKYASRGGFKLEKALQAFKVDVKDKIAIDIGASTGGFTDCLLQNCAKKVFAVDVGYGQLSYSLQNDSRVVRMDKTNARYITPEMFPELFDIAVIDVSFISVEKILPALSRLLKKDGCVIVLVKSNFEVGKGKVGKRGVVRDIELHKEVLKRLAEFSSNLQFTVSGITFSPLKGPAGNIEYFLYLTKDNNLGYNPVVIDDEINSVIESAKNFFDKNGI